MATIRREIEVAAAADAVWDAVRDFMNVDRRLVPGFVTASRPDPDAAGGMARFVTFCNGLTAREPLVTCDEGARRLVYGAIGGRSTHYNAAVQVSDEGAGRSIIVWTIDLLPDALAEPVGAMVEQAAAIMKRTLERG